MNMLHHDLAFWITVGVATVIKLLTSPAGSLLRTITTAIAAIFSAVVFTDPVLAWLGLDPATYKVAVAALLTLTGEGLMRVAMNLASDPAKAFDYLKAWRGGGK